MYYIINVLFYLLRVTLIDRSEKGKFHSDYHEILLIGDSVFIGSKY